MAYNKPETQCPWKLQVPNNSYVQNFNQPSNAPLVVRLYVYEWYIRDFKYLKGLKAPNMFSPLFEIPNSEFSVQLQLINEHSVKVIFKPIFKDSKNYSTSPSSIRHIEVKEQCVRTSNFDVYEVRIEFLDLNEKVIDYILLAPEVDKLLKDFICETEINDIKYIEKDTLRLRLKLTFIIEPISERKNVYSKSVSTLCWDLEKINQSSLFSDLHIEVGGQLITAHKYAILHPLKFMSKLVSELENVPYKNIDVKSSADLCGAFPSVSIPYQKAEVFKTILQYLYTGKIHPVDKIDYFDLLNFAQIHQLNELYRYLKPWEIHVEAQIQRSVKRFYWYIPEFGLKSLQKFNHHFSPLYKTSGSTSWRLMLYILNADSIFLSLKLESGSVNNFTYFRLMLCNPDGTVFEEHDLCHNFCINNYFMEANYKQAISAFIKPEAETLETPAISFPGFLDPDSRFCLSPDLVLNDTLCVACEIITCKELQSYVTSYILPEQNKVPYFKLWIKNLQYVLDNGEFSDITLRVGDTDFKAHKAILSARSPVFTKMFQTDMSEKLENIVHIEDLGCESMKYALQYIYTGSIDGLTMNEAPELYRTADKYEILTLKETCAEFICDNLDIEHACEILILSELFVEGNMMKLAKDMICRNAKLALLTDYGQEIMVNHTKLAEIILDSLSKAYCSLPTFDLR